MSLLNLTPAAAKRFHELMSEKKPKPEAILVSVKSQGCSGLGYDLSFLDRLSDKPVHADQIVEHGLTVVIDPKALPYVVGTIIDYTEKLERSGFNFINPNEASRCGCGESFSVKNSDSNTPH